MKLLLDTHLLLWWLSDAPELPEEARPLISDVDNLVLVSAASIWRSGSRLRLESSRFLVTWQWFSISRGSSRLR